MESNIKITVEGCSSARKTKIAEVIGKAMKDMEFGKVNITGTDFKGEYQKGMLKVESVEIIVIPEPFAIRDDFKGNREYLVKSRIRNRVDLDIEV